MSENNTGLLIVLLAAIAAGAGFLAGGVFGRKDEEAAAPIFYTPPPTPPILLTAPSGITAADLAASAARSEAAFEGLKGALDILGGQLGVNGNGSKSGRDSASKQRRNGKRPAPAITDIHGAFEELSTELRGLDVGLQEQLAKSKAHRRRAISSIRESRTQIVANLAARSRTLAGLERQGASIRRLVGGIR